MSYELNRADDAPRDDLIAEAGALVDALDEAMNALIDDCAGMNPSPAEMRAMKRLSIAHMHAERRVMRRIAAINQARKGK